jgi:glycosyltransferase involved in cell wall biosynthesis
MAQRILVVNHEASQSGAPAVAVRLLDALQSPGTQRILLHRWGGPFRAEMDSHADVSALEPLARLRSLARRWRLTKRSALRVEQWAASRVLDRYHPDLVWCNTVLSASYVTAAQRRRIPVVLHAHENADDITRVLGRFGLLSPARTAGVTLVGCSTQTAAALAAAVGRPATSAVTLASAVDCEAVATVGAAHRTARHETVHVVGCGQDLAVKGAETFASIATTVVNRRPATSFAWIGGPLGDFPPGSPAIHLGPVPSAILPLAGGDIFALTSRSDRFPLVVLEAMALGVAVVAFGVGDVAEQLGDTGIVIEPGDRAAMESAIIRLIDDPAERARLAAAARQRVADLWGIERFNEQTRQIAELAKATHALRPLRVLHLVWRLSLTGGIQVVVRNLIAGLDPDRFLIDVATVRPAVAMDELDALPDNVTVHPLGLAGSVSRLRSLGATRRFGSLIGALRPDIIHLHSGTAWLAAAAIRLVGRGVPVVIEVHDAPGHGRHSHRTETIEGHLARRNRWWVLTHAAATQADTNRAWQVTADRSVMFPLGIDTRCFAPATESSETLAARQMWRHRHGISDDDVAMICVARLVPSKRVDVLIDAVAHLRQEVEDRRPSAAHLVIVGDGPSLPALRLQAERLGITDAVTFAGGLAYRDIPEAMTSADLAVSASAYEGFGLTIIEAMAAGLAVVATNVGGVGDLIIDGQTGLLVAPNDAVALAAALAAVIEDPARRARMAAAGRARALSSFGIANLAANFAGLYELIHGHDHR